MKRNALKILTDGKFICVGVSVCALATIVAYASVGYFQSSTSYLNKDANAIKQQIVECVSRNGSFVVQKSAFYKKIRAFCIANAIKDLK